MRHEQGFPLHLLFHKDSSPVPQKKAFQPTLDMHPSHMKELSQGTWQRDKQTQEWGSRLYSRFRNLQHSLESALPCRHFYYGLWEDSWLCTCRGHTVVMISIRTMPLQSLESHQRHRLQGREAQGNRAQTELEDIVGWWPGMYHMTTIWPVSGLEEQ